MFAWTPSTQALPKPRECDDRLAKACKESKQGELDSTITDLVADNGGKTVVETNTTDNATEQHTCDVAISTDSLYTETVSTNTDLLGEDIGTQTTHTVDDAQTQTVRQICDVGIQLSLHFNHKETQTTCYVQHRGTITDDSEADATPFRLEQIKDDDQAVKFYTGFPTFLHLMTCFNFLRPAAFNLCYGATKKDIPSTGGRNHCLSSSNEFFLTLCRLRLALREQDLSYRF